MQHISFFFALGLVALLAGCQSPAPPAAADVYAAYEEPHRPQFHFTPPAQWMNDPNGMFFYEGEYHLFYQHYPDSNVWGPMHWGHAVSTDLHHWEHLPIALYPDSLGYIFSGSAVVDWKNTSGFGQDGQPPIVAIFTHHNMEGEKAGRKDFQYQSIAYSTDKGRTWTKYAGNPVIPNTVPIKDFRDPKVIWDDASEQWVMVFAANNHVKIWGSPDLKSWTHLSDFGGEWGSHGGVWECPDLFPMPVAGTNDTRWVLLLSINPGGPNGGSATQYFVGDFDGKTFTLDPTFAPSVANENAVWLDYGRDNYAGVTWSDVPKADGRRLFMGWMSNWDYAQVVPTQAWRSAMTLPRTLELKQQPQGYRLAAMPAGMLNIWARRTQDTNVAPKQLLAGESVALGLPANALQLSLGFSTYMDTTANFGVELTNTKGQRYRIGYDGIKKSFYSDRTKAGNHGFSDKFASAIHWAPRQSADGNVEMVLVFDVSSAELFADGGTTVMTDLFFPDEVFTEVRVYCDKGRVDLEGGQAFPLKSVWK